MKHIHEHNHDHNHQHDRDHKHLPKPNPNPNPNSNPTINIQIDVTTITSPFFIVINPYNNIPVPPLDNLEEILFAYDPTTKTTTIETIPPTNQLPGGGSTSLTLVNQSNDQNNTSVLIYNPPLPSA